MTWSWGSFSIEHTVKRQPWDNIMFIMRASSHSDLPVLGTPGDGRESGIKEHRLGVCPYYSDDMILCAFSRGTLFDHPSARL